MKVEAGGYFVMRITEKLDETRGDTQDSRHLKFDRISVTLPMSPQFR